MFATAAFAAVLVFTGTFVVFSTAATAFFFFIVVMTTAAAATTGFITMASATAAARLEIGGLRSATELVGFNHISGNGFLHAVHRFLGFNEAFGNGIGKKCRAVLIERGYFCRVKGDSLMLFIV